MRCTHAKLKVLVLAFLIALPFTFAQADNHAKEATSKAEGVSEGFHVMDIDGSESVNFKEYIGYAKKMSAKAAEDSKKIDRVQAVQKRIEHLKSEGASDEEMQRALDRLDAVKTQQAEELAVAKKTKLTKAEVSTKVASVDEDQWMEGMKKRFGRMDSDGDGELTLAEYEESKKRSREAADKKAE